MWALKLLSRALLGVILGCAVHPHVLLLTSTGFLPHKAPHYTRPVPSTQAQTYIWTTVNLSSINLSKLFLKLENSLYYLGSKIFYTHHKSTFLLGLLLVKNKTMFIYQSLSWQQQVFDKILVTATIYWEHVIDL